MDRLRIGIVGVGALGRIHVGAYGESAAVGRLVICDPDEKRLAEVQAAYPVVARGYSSLEAMLEAERLDAVSIITPDHLHRPQSVQCFQAGCHVLLAKPLATSLEDGRAIVRAAEAAGRILMVAHERRFRPSTIAIRRLLEEGRLGEIIHLRIDSIQDKRTQFLKSPWYASAEAGRTALVGSGIHEVDRLRFLIGRPIVSVAAFSNRLGTLAFPLAKTTSAIYQFEGGAIGQVTISYEAHWPQGNHLDDSFRLIGSTGLIVGHQAAWDGHEGWEPLPREQNAVAEGSRGCVAAFLKTLVEGAPVAVTGRDAFASLAAAVAADESAATGQKTAPAPADFM